MKKTLCLILCVLVLLPAVLLFSSCKKGGDGEVSVSKKTVEINLSGYSIVKNAGYSDLSSQRLTDLANILRVKTGVTVRVNNDTAGEVTKTTDLEILVGDVKRDETVKALKKIKGDGYIITVTDNKLVIAGTTAFLTSQAVEYFFEHCLPAEKTGGTITVPKQVLLGGVSMVEVTTGDSANYSVVYSSELDAETGSAEGKDPQTTKNNPESVDIPVACARSATTLISKLTGVKKATRMTDKAASKGSEIIFGITTREGGKTVLNTLNANQYGVIAADGNIYVTSWSDTGMRKAGLLVESILTDSVVEKDGVKQIVVPAELRVVKDMDSSKWVTDFTKPSGEGIELSGVQDIADDSLLYYYTGSGVSSAAYENYCKVLTGEGYTLYTDNTNEGNIYRTYNSKDNKHTLYVVYAAYAHATEQNVHGYVSSIRVISAPMSSVNLVRKELLSEQKYTKIADSSITTVRLQYEGADNFGMNYVIMLEDGSFIVYDGGGKGQSNPANDHVRLYNVLVDLYKKAHNDKNPTNENPLVIAGWILTHQHWDHISVFRDFCEKYGGYQQVRIEALYANFISETEAFNAYNPDFSLSSKLQTYVDMTNNSFKYYKLHSGMKLHIRNATLEVLYTHEDMFPSRIYYFNDSSTVVRFTIRNSQGGKETTATFLGDLYKYGSKVMRALYGSSLKCDIVQLAHHGYQGCEIELYKLFSPELVLWPTSSSSWEAQIKNANSKNWWYVVDYFVANQLESVKYIIVQDQKNTTLTLGKNGPEYGNLYSPVDGGNLSFAERDPYSSTNFLIKK